MTYTLTVMGKGGCIESDQVQVLVLKPVLPPNTFTPNGDNKNDRWNIPDLAKYPGVVVTIFNRYGTKIYTSNGYDILHNLQPLIRLFVVHMDNLFFKKIKQ